jgi:protoporphyrinogen oxidase
MNLGIWRSAMCMLSYAKAKAFPTKNPRSFEQWVINQFGHKLYSIFFKTYTEKVWGMPCDEMSADWAAQRIKGLSLGGAVIDGLKRSLGLNKRRNDGMAVKTLLETFRYPRQGPGMMWDAARDKVLAGGNRVLMGTALHQISQDQATGRWRVAARRGDDMLTISAGHVISSAPMRELAGRIHPLPATLPNALDLNYRDFLTVALMIRSDDLFPDNWIYIHDPRVKVGRVQNFRSWSPEMVPDETLACVGLEYFCFEGDGLWSASDDDLVALATKELATLGLADPATVVGGRVVRQEKAYPVYDDAYRANVEEMRGELEARYPTLHLVGRNGMHRYNNQDHAMMTAMLTVRNIQAGERIYDIWAVNEDAEYHESGNEGERAALASERLVPARLGAAA